MPKDLVAILVAHDEATSAQKALAAIRNQTFKPNRIVIVDSSQNPVEFDQPTIRVSPKTKLGSIIASALESIPVTNETWFWLVHDDSEPKPNALAELVAATEGSESVAQVGPMQLSARNSRTINQLGLKLSRFGELINPIRGQLDQGQHDRVFDVQAVSTSGMLVNVEHYLEVGGLHDNVAALASDVDLGIRFNRHGYRVLAAPRAKVVHSELLLKGARSKQWLGGSRITALRKATIQLRLTHDPLLLALLYWLFLPLVTIYRVFWRLAQKRPSHLLPELRAGFWGWFTLPKRIGSRRNVGKLKLARLSSLRATGGEVSAHNRRASEVEESANSMAAFERGEHETQVSERAKNFVQSGGWLFALGLMALSWKQLPLSAAISGGSALPTSNNWFDLFARAGASWQPIGQGFVGPSDPFNWVLLALTSLTFWAPNLSLVILLWMARSLAFATAWKALSLVTAKAWQRNLGALLFALLPAFTASIANGEWPAILATILVPWLVFSVARAAGLGRSGSARSDSRTWSWVGLSGLLLAAISAAAPAVTVLALLALAVVAFTKLRRFGYLFWIPLPLGAIYLPLVWTEIVGYAHPLALLAEPSIGVSKSSTIFSWWLAGVAVLAILSLLSKRWVVALSIWSFTIAGYLVLQFTESLRFPADNTSALTGVDRVGSSGNSISAVIGLAVIALAVHFSAQLNSRLWSAVVGIVILVSAFPLGYLSATSTVATKASDGSVVPLLLQKQAEQGTDLQLLIMDLKDSQYRVQWLPVAGLHLEDNNLAYRFGQAQAADSNRYQELAQAVGDLASANGLVNKDVLVSNHVGYLLVPNTKANTPLVAALEASEFLEGAGQTPFGELWRVTGVSASGTPKTFHSPWSVTKLIQLLALLGFLLLAIPSRPKVRKAKDSEIFIDQSESDLDV